MPAELRWSCSGEHDYDLCHIVRGVGEMFHVVIEGARCTSDIPLPTLRVHAPGIQCCIPVAVLADGICVLAAEGQGLLNLVDTQTGLRRPFGQLPDDGGYGTDVCQVADGRVVYMAAGHLGAIRDIGGRIDQVEGFDALGVNPRPGLEWPFGAATSIAAFGETVVVGGPQLEGALILARDGGLRRRIGPSFAYKGETYSFTYEWIPSYVENFRELSGVHVDPWGRVWIAVSSERVAVFTDEGHCQYLSGPDELIHAPDEGMSARLFHLSYGSSSWGIDSRGWLWCHGGNAAFGFPELDMAPALSPAFDRGMGGRTGLEPDRPVG